MELTYTARIMNEVEVEFKRSFFEAVMTYSMRTVEVLVRKGLGLRKEQQDIVWAKIDEYVKASPENSLETLWIECLQTLQKAGFLAKTVDTQGMMEGVRNPQETSGSPEIASPIPSL